MKWVLRIIKIPFVEKKEIVWSVWQLLLIDRKLRKSGLVRTKRYLATSMKCPSTFFLHDDPRRISRTVHRAATMSIGHKSSCLRKSLLVWSILKHRAISSSLQLGMRSKDGDLTAHAWVEVNGVPINDFPSIRDAYQLTLAG